MLSVKTATISPKKDLQKNCMKFIDAGIACYAVCLLDTLGIINDLLNKKFIEKSDLKESFDISPILLNSAFKTLCLNGILEEKDDVYLLTTFGTGLFQNIGFINLLYGSYTKLLSNFDLISKKDIQDPSNLIDYEKMAYASDQLATQGDNLLLKELEKLDFSGFVAQLSPSSLAT